MAISLAQYRRGHLLHTSLGGLSRLGSNRLNIDLHIQALTAKLAVQYRSCWLYPFHVAVWPLRRARLARWAALAELTPASAGQCGGLRLRMHSIQLVRCSSSPSGT